MFGRSQWRCCIGHGHVVWAIIFVVARLCSFSASRAADSTWVKVGVSGRLIYGMDDTGDRVLDYSTVGYQSGLVPLPDFSTLGVPTISVTPIAGENLSRLQNAINQAAAMPMKANGFRGVVQLAPGTYNISDGLAINTSGIIFRGAVMAPIRPPTRSLPTPALRKST